MRDLPPIQSLWDYDDPASTEHRLRALISQAEVCPERSYHAELMTQIARTMSLRGRFDEAHALLDEADAMISEDMPRARVRSLLERGRTINSAGEGSGALKYFIAAWELACRCGLDGLAVDAAHMCAIVQTGEEALRWNAAALTLACSSTDPDARRWQGSLCNNIGWTYHGLGHYHTALRSFEQALRHREEQGNLADIRIARWCIARCLRSLGRVEEALAIQRALAAQSAEPDAQGDGLIAEEIAECLHVLEAAGRQDGAEA